MILMSTQVQKAQTLTPLLKNKEGLPDVPSPFIMVCAYFGYLIKLYYARIFSHPMLLNIFYNKLKNGRDAFCLCEYQLCYLDMEQDTRKKWSRNAQQVVSYRTNSPALFLTPKDFLLRLKIILCLTKRVAALQHVKKRT